MKKCYWLKSQAKFGTSHSLRLCVCVCEYIYTVTVARLVENTSHCNGFRLKINGQGIQSG